MEKFTSEEIKALTARGFEWNRCENRWIRDFSELPEVVYKFGSSDFTLIEHEYNHQIHDYQRSRLTFKSIPDLLAHLK